MSQKAKSAAMAEQSLSQNNLQGAGKQDLAIDFLLNGLGGGVGGVKPRGTAAPTQNPFMAGMYGVAPKTGAGIDRAMGAYNAMSTGDMLGLARAAAPQTMGKIGSLAGWGAGGAGAGAAGAAGTAAGTSATAAGTGAAAGSGAAQGVLSKILALFAA